MNEANPLNGTRVADAAGLLHSLRSIHDRPPFFVELIGDNGFIEGEVELLDYAVAMNRGAMIAALT